MRFELVAQQRRVVVYVENNASDSVVNLEGREYRVRLERTDEPDELIAHVNGRTVRVRLLEETESSITLGIEGERITFRRQLSKFERADSRERRSVEEKDVLQSPMPGRVVSIMVVEGQTVRSGDPLLIMESMKMETILMSDRDGQVSEIPVHEGEAVIRGQTLIRYAKNGAKA